MQPCNTECSLCGAECSLCGTKSNPCGTDAALVTIDTDDGEVRLNAPADYEAKSSYSFTVNVTDGELTDSQDLTVSVTNVNEVPSFTSGTSFTAAENQLDTGYTPAATDPENDSVTFTINGGADADKFELVGGALKFRTAPDFDTPGSADSDNVYEVQIQASDGNGGTASQTVSVTVTNVDESTANSQFQVLKIEPKSGQIGFGYSANTLGDGSHLYGTALPKSML